MTKDDGLSLNDFMPQQATLTAEGGYRASAGESVDGVGRASEEDIVAALKTVHDPEIPVNIYDLGLIYDVTLNENGNVHIVMSLTAPGCPVAGEMPGLVARTVAKLPHVGRVDVDLVWEPAWTKDRMSSEARLALDF